MHYPKLKMNTLQKTQPKVDEIEKTESGNESEINPNSYCQNSGQEPVFHPVGE